MLNINKFQADVVADMDEKTFAAWESLSDFERQLITAQTYFFIENKKSFNLTSKLEKKLWSLV